MTTPTCSATWKGGKCQDPAEKAGRCLAHYRRDRRGGRPGPVRRLDPTKRLNLYLEAGPRRRVEELAKAQGRTLGALVRDAVDRYLVSLGWTP